MGREWKSGECLVFEAVNHERRELVIVVGWEGFESSFRSDADLLPPEWQAGDHIDFRVVERDLSLDAAAEFALRYGASAALSPFRVYLGGMAPLRQARPAAVVA